MREYLVPLKEFGDERGNLVSIEAMRTIPFNIKRTYYLTNLKMDEPRGFHAHKKLKQFAICLKGSCRFVMEDENSRKEFVLNKSNQGIKIDPMVWHEMHDFSQDCVLLVLADDYYDEADYIRSYEEFKKAIL
jgi:dTDP-4-dehydrorhamnose 3,5-epimerase-like enzyme